MNFLNVNVRKCLTHFSLLLHLIYRNSHLICVAHVVTSFYMKCNTGMKLVKRDIRKPNNLLLSKNQSLPEFHLLGNLLKIVTYLYLPKNLIKILLQHFFCGLRDYNYNAYNYDWYYLWLHYKFWSQNMYY